MVVEQDDQGLGLFVDCDVTNYHLIVRQKPDGSFLVQEIRGRRAFAAYETSFLTFCCKHRAFADQTLLPLMEHLGIAPPEASHHPDIDAAVLAGLEQPSVEPDGEDSQRLLRQLGDDNFQVREQATQKLKEGFATYQTLLREAVNDKSHSLEARARIRESLPLFRQTRSVSRHPERDGK